MTIREFTSTIQNSLKSLSYDDYIQPEYIFNVGKSIASLLIKRETDSRKIFKNTSLFKTLPCIDMVEALTNECGIRLDCSSLRKSKKPLPEIFTTNFGSLIFVYNVLRNVDYKEISPLLFNNQKKLRYKPKNVKYFWIENNHLYIPDSEVESVIVSIMSPNIESINEFLGEKECNSILESEFPVPDYLLSVVISETLNIIFNSKRVNPDEKPNLNNNEK